MFGLGAGEMLVVAILALIFIGPDRLPDLARKLGRWGREFRDLVNEFKTNFFDDDSKR